MAAKRCLDQDPDYENIPVYTNEKRLKILENDAREATVKKVEAILKTHFRQELANREAEIETVDKRIHETRAILDRLRACIVTKYYATAGQSGEQVKQESSCTSIHPTVKRYLGKTVPTRSSLQPVPSLHKEKSNGDSTQPSIPASSSSPPMPSLTAVEASSTPECTTSTSFSTTSQRYCETGDRVSRLKEKCSIIIGNVSKFIPSDYREESDQSTHKWMVYVRGDKDNPQINHIVRKVLFFLHPSYRPNDIVEVCEPPFHLTRKGWGEFPIRVQLHFHNTRNKPVDIIHNLKLDKTYTGLQTLGSETIVDLWLFRSERTSVKHFQDSLVLTPQKTSATGSEEKPSLSNSQISVQKSNDENKEASESQLVNSVGKDVSSICKSFSSTSVVSKPCSASNLLLASSSSAPSMPTLVTSSAILPSPVKYSSLATIPSCTVSTSPPTSSNTPTLNISSYQTVPSKANPKVSLVPLSASSYQGIPVTSSLTVSSLPATNSPIGSKMILLVSSGSSKQNAEITQGNVSSVTRPNLSSASKTNLTSSISSVKLTVSPSITNDKKQPVSTSSPPNGINKFVKCIDSQGRILLVPQSSLILVQSPASKMETTKTTLKTQLNPAVSSNSVEHVSQSVKQEPQSLSICTSAQLKKITNQNAVLDRKPDSKTVESAVPSYTVRVVSGQGLNKPSQVILIPTSSKTAVDNKKVPFSSSSKSSALNSKQGSKEIAAKGQLKLVKKQNSEAEVKEALSSLRHHKFDSLAQFVRRLVLIYPLVSSNADHSFHPYCASSLEEFFSWNIGKQRAAEWNRASCIRAALLEFSKEENDSFSWTPKELWTRKQIMWWCRKHGYTPFKSGKQEQQEQQFCNLRTESQPVETASTPHELLHHLEEQQEFLKKNTLIRDDEINIIDVDDDDGDVKGNRTESQSKKSEEYDKRHIKIYLPSSRPAVDYVREAASMIGMKLEPQEIIPSVSAPVVEEMLLKACQGFASDILRTALSHGFERNGGKICPEEVTVEDVCKSLQELPFCDFLTNSYLGISANPVENTC